MSKSIRLSDEAYEQLSARKQEDESFSEVVLRLTGEQSLLELAGTLSDEEADEVESAIEERRKRRQGDLDAVTEQLREA